MPARRGFNFFSFGLPSGALHVWTNSDPARRDRALARMRDVLAVSLTGQLRWFQLTLATLRRFLLFPLNHPWRGFYVGPADEGFDLTSTLHRHFAEVEDSCFYATGVKWARHGPSAPFEMRVGAESESWCATHGKQAVRSQLEFNADRVPIFGICDNGGGRNQRESFLPLLTPNGPICTLAVSLIMQMWQAAQIVGMIEDAEQRVADVWHGRVLRLRADLFFMHEVHLPLPKLANHTQRWFSLMEDTCADLKRGSHVTLYSTSRAPHNSDRRRFISDLWTLGDRAALQAGLGEPLRVMLGPAAERRDPVQWWANSTDVWKRGFYVQPWPFALTRHGSAACVNYRGMVGILRINPRERCFTVQLRLQRPLTRVNVAPDDPYGPFYPRSWRSIDITRPGAWSLTSFEWEKLAEEWKPGTRAETEVTETLLQLGTVMERCAGLISNQSCPRTVGDRQMAGYIEGRQPTSSCESGFVEGDQLYNRYNRRRGNNVTSVVVRGCDDGGELLSTAGQSLFECVDMGLAPSSGSYRSYWTELARHRVL